MKTHQTSWQGAAEAVAQERQPEVTFNRFQAVSGDRCCAVGQSSVASHRGGSSVWRRLSASRNSVAASTDSGVVRSFRSMDALSSYGWR